MTRQLSEPGAAHVRAGGELVQIKPRPSATRSASARRVRLAQEALKGNQRSLRHGINAQVHNIGEVADELSLIFATHPHLHPLQDFRLAELTAIAHVAYRRAQLAIEKDGLTTTLVRYETNVGARLERLLRAVHERNVERARDAARAEQLDLTRYQRAKVVTP